MMLCCVEEKDTNISSYDVMLCGRERYKYLELLTTFLRLTHELTPYKCQNVKLVNDLPPAGYWCQKQDFFPAFTFWR